MAANLPYLSERGGPGRERTRRRGELLDAADRVIRRSGPTASMTAIAAEAGITKPILYRHFGDKGGLYGALAERYVGALMVELRSALQESSDPRGRLEATVDAYLEFVDRQSDVYRFLMHRAVRERPEAQAAVADFISRVAREVAIELREDLARYGIETGGAEPLAYGIVGLVQLAGDWWLQNRTMTRAEIRDYLVTLLWSGFSRFGVTEENV
jgi:AcrR family transcriptional regulator